MKEDPVTIWYTTTIRGEHGRWNSLLGHIFFLSSAVKCSFKPSISSMFCFIPHLGNATNQMWITNDFILESKCHFQLFLEFLMSKHVQGCSRRKRPFLYTPMLGNTCKLFLPSKWNNRNHWNSYKFLHYHRIVWWVSLLWNPFPKIGGSDEQAPKTPSPTNGFLFSVNS